MVDSILRKIACPALCAGALALSCLVVLPSCGSTSGAPGSTPAEPPQPLTEEEYKAWDTGGAEFEGRQATVTGQVFNIQREGDTIAYQIHTDPTNYGGNTVVTFTGDDPGINNDDCLRATGIVQKDFEGENALGGSVVANALLADSVEKITYQEATAPTIAYIEPAVTSEYNGYSVTIDKIEFSEPETRVYVTVNNNGAGRLSLYEYSAVIIQNGQQYNIQYNYAANYPTISNQVAMGASISGIMCFPKIEQSSLQIQLQGSSDNWEADPGTIDFNFDITVQ